MQSTGIGSSFACHDYYLSASSYNTQQRCSVHTCREEGHNRRKCPNANPTSTSGSGRGTN